MAKWFQRLEEFYVQIYIYELHYGTEIQNTLGPFVQIHKSSFNCYIPRLFGSVVRVVRALDFYPGDPGSNSMRDVGFFKLCIISTANFYILYS